MSQTIKILLVCLVMSQICAAIPVSFDAAVEDEAENKQLKCIKGDDLEDGQQGNEETQSGQGSRCPFCEQGFDRLRGYKTKCNHTFHDHCLYDWVYEFKDEPRYDCPICQKQLVFGSDTNYYAYFWDEMPESVKKLLKDDWGAVLPSRSW